PGTQLAEHLLLPAEIVILIVGVYCTAVLAFAFAHRREGATGFLLGFAFFFITVINDILFERDIIQTEVFAPLGLFVLLMADSLMLLRRFVGLIDTVEKQQAALVGAAELKERLTRARLQTKRMEFEMLKKAIQPHFLSNSLAAIRGWLLENPEKSANLLDDFAGEIALIQAMVGQKDVPLADEIRLCRLHLHVMEARREKIYSFRARGMTGHERVPPMIFHTMLENAFTHLDTENGSLRFSLRKTSSKSTTEVVSRFAFAVSNHDAGSIRQRKRGNGIGLRYVQARLEESFPGSWTLEQKRCRKGYLIRINIKEGADANTDR
ncbi:MAG TPA: histidine kinase, partial [Leptospiraceae bacterium]|nr:histidine kinase [Leptospiraceae bacterium]